MTENTFSERQRAAIDYIVLCSVNQGFAYRNGKDAVMAVEITLQEDLRLKSHQLRHPDSTYGERMFIGARMRKEAERRVTEEWNEG